MPIIIPSGSGSSTASTAYNFTYNGLTVGPGTSFPVVEVAGIEDLPNIRTADFVKAQDWGSYAGLDLTDVRDITLTVFIQGSTPGEYDALVNQFMAAYSTQTTELPLVFSGLQGVQQQIMCRPRKRGIPRTAQNVSLMTTATVTFEAMDPRIYSATLHQVGLNLETGDTSGISWNITWPVSWGATNSDNYATLSNAGSTSTGFTATITGPVTNPVVTNATTGQSMAINLTLASTDVLVIDFGNRTITLNGTASRRGSMTPASSFWTLPPGNTNILYTAATATSSTCSLAWRDAWV